MAKFCRSCGAPVEEGAEKCGACGASLKTPAVPEKKPSDTLNKVSDVINTIFHVVERALILFAGKVSVAVKNAKADRAARAANPAGSARIAKPNDSSLNVVRLAVVAVMILLALSCTIMNLTMKYDINMKATVTYDGEKQSATESIAMEEIAGEDEFIGLTIVNLLYAVFNLALIVMAILVIVKVVRLIHSDGSFTALAMTGLIGDVLYMILYKICGSGSQSAFGATMKYSAGLHFVVWIHFVVFAAATVLAFLAVKPVLPAAAPQDPAE